MTDRGDTELLEVVSGQRREDRGIDVVVAKRGGVPLQAQVSQPSRDVHRRFLPSGLGLRVARGSYAPSLAQFGGGTMPGAASRSTPACCWRGLALHSAPAGAGFLS